MKKNERDRERGFVIKKRGLWWVGWKEANHQSMSPKSLALERRSGMYRRQWLELLSSEKLEGRKCIVRVCVCVRVDMCGCGGG